MSHIVEQCSASLEHHDVVETRQPRKWTDIQESDQQLMRLFVELRGAGSKNTFKRYFRTIVQFMTWWDQPLSALTSDAMRNYQHFLLNPSNVFQELEDYPFRPLAYKTVDDTFDILKTFSSFLIDERILNHNPAKNVRRLQKGGRGETKNYLSDFQWQALWETLDNRVIDSLRIEYETERLRYCLAIQYGLALRPHEMAIHHQAMLYPSGNRWKIDILGKGNKARTISVPKITLQAMARYNSFLALDPPPVVSPVPFLPALYPLIRKKRGPNMGVSMKKSMSEDRWQRMFKELIKEVFDKNAAQHNRDLAWRKEWRDLSAHCLRHTRLTHLLKREKWDALKVMKFAGHSNLNTTQIYFHLNIDE